MRKLKTLIFLVVLSLSLNSCGIFIDLDTPKSSELSEEYEYYQDSVNTIRSSIGTTPEEADEIFIVLVSECGIDKKIGSIYKNSLSGDNCYTVYSGFNSLDVYLTSDNVVSKVLKSGKEIYPCDDFSETSEQLETLTESKEEINAEKYSSISQLELDELQQLYLEFDSSMSYSDALKYIQNTGLPYSEAKYNSSRVFQVALTDGCTAQKYMKESGPYIEIIYEYAKGENSGNDDKAKYSFGTCVYVPITGFSLIVNSTGHYFDISSSGTYIKQCGDTLDELTNLSKEEQLLYYFNNQ